MLKCEDNHNCSAVLLRLPRHLMFKLSALVRSAELTKKPQGRFWREHFIRVGKLFLNDPLSSERTVPLLNFT